MSKKIKRNRKKSEKSKKHHFIPRFILSKFYSEYSGKNGLCTFNKRTEKLNVKLKSSKSICFEDDLYTVYICGDSFVEIENFYSKIESLFSNLIAKIDNNEKEFFLFQKYLEETNGDKIHWHIISFFLNIFFWRLPNYTHSERLKLKLRDVYRNSSNEIKKCIPLTSSELKFFERNSSDFAKKITSYVILPACLSRINQSILKCKFIRTDFDLIISDRPIICDIDKDTGELCGDIYMPLSPRLCITNNPEKINEFQRQIFQQAENIVIANSDKLLFKIWNEIRELSSVNTEVLP